MELKAGKHFKTESWTRLDPSNLRADFDEWPSLASRSWEKSEPPILDKKYDSIVFAGLGGSGIIGEVIADLSKEYGTIRVETLKDYHLPKYVNENTLVVGVSCSGNTEETLSVVSEANRQGLDICTFGSGGKLESYSKENPRIKFTKTEMLKVPRSSFPGLFFPVMKFMTQNGFLAGVERDVPETISMLSRVRDTAAMKSTRSNKAPLLGTLLGSNGPSVPLIYSSKRTRAIGMRFRQSLNENAKMHAYDGEVPELCHNEIVAWDSIRASKKTAGLKSSKSMAIELRLPDDPEELSTRFDIIETIISRSRGRTNRAPHLGNSYLARIISMLYFLDYSSYFTALSRGVDPILTPSITLLKSELHTRLNYLSRIDQSKSIS